MTVMDRHDSSTEPQPMLHFKEVANILGISRRKLEYMMDEPQYRYALGAKKIGNRWRFIRSRVAHFSNTWANF